MPWPGDGRVQGLGVTLCQEPGHERRLGLREDKLVRTASTIKLPIMVGDNTATNRVLDHITADDVCNACALRGRIAIALTGDGMPVVD